MENRRQGDRVLNQLKQDFIEHRAEFGSLVDRFERHVAEEHEDRKENHRVQRENAKNISNLTIAVTDLTKTVQTHIETTQPVVDKYRDLQGAARVSDEWIDRIIRWGKVGGVVSILAAFLLWMLEHLPKH